MKQRAKKAHKLFRRRLIRSRKRAVRYGLITINLVLFVATAAFVITSQSSSDNTSLSLTKNNSIEEKIANPLDALSGPNIALNVALMAGLEESSAIVHETDAETAKAAIVQSDPQIVAKPQIIANDIKTIDDVIQYVIVAGDTLEEIAARYDVSADSIRWSNDIRSGTDVDVGDSITIPPINGVLYTVTEGDTVESLAEAYDTATEKIISFNDIELTGLVAGEQVLLPSGRVKPTPQNNFNYAYSPTYGGNNYAPGNCTWHTANRRAAVGKPLPANLGNAATWHSRAALAGLPTGNTPQQYAAVVTNTWGYGHVGFVEEVYPDGSMLMTEMNYNWSLYALRERVVPADQAASYLYVY